VTTSAHIRQLILDDLVKLGPALISFGVLTVIYVGALVYVDRQNHVFERAADLAFVLPQVALVAFVSYVLRYARWRWLLGAIFRFPM
jgi:hypothetical protein